MFGKYPVPAKRYPLFIEVIEKQVTEAQERVKRMEVLEYPYVKLTEVMEKINLDNVVKIDIEPSFRGAIPYINVCVTGLPSDLKKKFDDLAEMIDKTLTENQLRTKEQNGPAFRKADLIRTLEWSWKKCRSFKGDFMVYLKVEVPENGMRDVEVHSRTKQHMYTTTETELKILDNPKPLGDVKHARYDRFAF